MADNTANIRVVADEQGLNNIQREVNQTSRDFRQLGDEIERTDRVGQHMADSVKGFALSFLTIEAAINGARIALSGLKASFDAYAATNDDLIRQQEILEERINRTSESFGRSVFGDGTGERLLQSFANLVRVVGDEQGYLAQETRDAISVTTDFINLLAEGIEHIQNHQDSISRVRTTYSRFLDLLNPGRVVIRNFRQELRDLFAESDRMVGKTTQAATRGAIYAEDAPMFGPELPPTAAVGAGRTGRGGGGRSSDLAREIMKRGLAAQQEAKLRALQDFAEEEKAQRVAQEQEAKDEQRRWVEEQLEAQRIAGEKQLELTRQIAERDMAIKDEFRQKELAKEAEALAIREQRAAEANRILGGAAGALASMNFKEAENRKKVAKDTAAAILRAEGAALIGKGTGNLIALNPIGALQVAGGGAMIAAANRISGGGGGGGGAGATPRQTVQGPSQTIVNPTVSFGFVGDRRAAYRDVEEANRRAMERS
jgi:hypothetical protein